MAEEKDDKLSPDTSPNAKTGSGVKRINNLPLYIIGCIGTLFVIMVVIIASGKGQPTGPSQEGGESAQGSGQVANNDLFADELTRDYQAGVINPEGMNIEDTQKAPQPEVEPAPNLDQPPLRVAKPTDQELQDAPKQVSAATIQDRRKTTCGRSTSRKCSSSNGPLGLRLWLLPISGRPKATARQWPLVATRAGFPLSNRNTSGTAG